MIIMHTTCHRELKEHEKRIYNESCQMAKKGHKIIIAAPEETPLMIKCKKRGFKCFSIEFTARSAFKDYFALKRIYKKFKPDVLNTHGNTDSKIALAAAWKIGIPCTILSRHISADVKPSWYNKFLYNNLCRYVFTTADYTTNHLISNLGIDPGRIFTLPSGISPPQDLQDHDSARIALAAELNSRPGLLLPVTPESRFIGFAGRVSEDKGVDCIIKAFLLIADKVPGYHLVIVGQLDTSSQKGIAFIDQLKAIINQGRYKDFIHFTGFKENTWPYYRAFDCKILASKEVEGISQSLLEAMYAKCPVAGSRIGGTSDIIKDGETGLLFGPGQSQEIAQCILNIINEKGTTGKRVSSAFRMVKDKYTIDSMVNRILDIYHTAIRN
ncbi:MAG: glycosyltransferase family 4 protein [Desulfamplus sp.]|nr:glycosyltransferase family 4 protein [Desulfamplus sp.]